MLSPNIVSYVANETIPAGARVKFVAGSAIRVQLAGVADVEIGTAILHSGKETYAVDTPVGVKLMNDAGTRTCIAVDAIAAGAIVYRAASGKVSVGGGGDAFGFACEASAANLDFIEVLVVPSIQALLDDGNSLQVATATFNPTANVGERTIAPHTLVGASIPALALVVGGFVQVNTTFTSATDAGTIAVSIEGANDIVVAIAISNGANPWDAGKHAIIPKANTPESTSVATTVVRTPVATVAVEALTAGKFTLFLYYVQGA